MKKNIWFAGAVSIVLVAFVGILFGTSQASAQAAPDFKLKGLDGKAVQLSDFKGKVIILDFWATWCPPCKAEIPGFIQLQEQYGEDLIIIGISLDQAGPQAVEPFAKKKGINYPVLYGYGTQVPQQYGGVSGIPTTFVIDRDLKVQRKYVGYTKLDVFRQDVETFL